MNESKRYDALDGVRVLAMTGILVMHVLANLSYRDELATLYSYIMYFGRFTSLFMMVSAFSVSCGYYKKIQSGFSNIEKFYSKRYAKILPFFAFITLIDVLLSFSKESIFEGFANITLVFGLIPHESISVIGVGWTLGVIFVFYLLYPFVVYLMKNRIRFCLSYIATLIYAFVVNDYFGLEIELNQRFSVSNTAVIKNGIYLEDYKKSVDRRVVRRKEKIPEDAFVIVHVGRFAGVKNHDFLVDVFEQIKKKNKKAYLLMIGSGETEGKVRAKLNEKKLDGSYTILHNRTDVSALLKASDAAVFPSNTEGLGIAVIEMQAAGLPIVASCGVPKLTQVSNYITYVDLKQGAEYWADELMRLVESTINDKQLYVDSWDVKSSVSELQKLYESSLEME